MTIRFLLGSEISETPTGSILGLDLSQDEQHAHLSIFGEQRDKTEGDYIMVDTLNVSK